MKFYILLAFLTAALLEILGTVISVSGLAKAFGGSALMIAFAIALDMGKIVVVSTLYRSWDSLTALMKTYSFIAVFVTMGITSGGAAGWLTSEFEKGANSSKIAAMHVDALSLEKSALESRKKQIDDGIASLPERMTANQRIRMIAQFKDEAKTIRDRLAMVDSSLQQEKVNLLNVSEAAGPIAAIVRNFKVDEATAIKIAVGALISVFDPLAIYLIILGNFLLMKNEDAEEEVIEPQATDEIDSSPPPIPDEVMQKIEERDESALAALIEELEPAQILIEELFPTPTPVQASTETDKVVTESEEQLDQNPPEGIIIKHPLVLTGSPQDFTHSVNTEPRRQLRSLLSDV